MLTSSNEASKGYVFDVESDDDKNCVLPKWLVLTVVGTDSGRYQQRSVPTKVGTNNGRYQQLSIKSVQFIFFVSVPQELSKEEVM